MMTVISFQISNLRQQEDFGFHKITLSILGSCDDPKLSPLITTYQAAFQAFDNALKPMNAENVLTLPISQKNEQCVNLYRGIRLQVKAMELHFDPDLAEIARQAKILIDRYGDLISISYLEQIGGWHNLLQDLEAFDNPGEEEGGTPGTVSTAITHNLLSAIFIDTWVDRLKTELANFEALYKQRNDEKSVDVVGQSKASREATDEAYRAVVRRINALVEVNGDEEYLSIINPLNELIERQKTVLSARKTNNAKQKEEDPAETTPPTEG